MALFEKELIKKEKPDVIKNFRIVDALYNEAVELGVFPQLYFHILYI